MKTYQNTSKLDIEKLKKDIKHAKESEDANNGYYKKLLAFFFDSSLYSEDKNALDANEKPKFVFNMLTAIVNGFVKQIADSLPSTGIKSSNVNDQQSVMTAEVLSKNIEKVFKDNRFDIKMVDASETTLIGGKAIFKLSTEYVDDSGFDQKITVELVPDPTKVYFDPSAITPTRGDAQFVVEEFCLSERNVMAQFPDIDIKKLKTGIVQGDGADKKYIFYRYYTYNNTKKTLYLMSDGAVVDKKPDESEPPDTDDEKPEDSNPSNQLDMFSNTESAPKPKSKSETERVVYKKEIRCITISGDTVLSNIPLNCECLPFIQLTAGQYIDGTNAKIISFIHPALDAQRAKNLIANEFFGDAFSLYKSTYIITKEALKGTQTLDNLRNPNTKSFLIVNGFDVNQAGQERAVPPPKIVPPSQIPPEYAQMFAGLDSTIQTILGAYQINKPENMSGIAMYNMSQYVSGMLAPFTNNLLQTMERMAVCMISMFKKLNSPETVQRDGAETNIDYEYDIRKFNVHVEAGVNYKLQQEATLQHLLKLAEISPDVVSPWLNTPEIVKYLLQNMSLNNKASILQLFDKFVEKEQQQQQQQQQQPNPEVMKEQNISKELQLREQELQLKAHQGLNDNLLKMHQMRQQGTDDTQKNALVDQKIKAENFKSVLNSTGDMIKTHITKGHADG